MPTPNDVREWSLEDCMNYLSENDDCLTSVLSGFKNGDYASSITIEHAKTLPAARAACAALMVLEGGDG